jgi:hypothetical protein
MQDFLRKKPYCSWATKERSSVQESEEHGKIWVMYGLPTIQTQPLISIGPRFLRIVINPTRDEWV